MIVWRIHGADRTVGEELPSLVASGFLHPQCPVSADQGRTWIPALEAARRLQLRGDDGLAMVVPMRTATWAAIAQYMGLFSLLFFGGPISGVALMMASGHGPTRLARLCLVLFAFVMGPLPIAISALLGQREIRRDPTLRGSGRVIFAWVCAGLMGVAVLGAFALAVVR